MSLVTLLTTIQILCYQACAWPGIARIIKRKSSSDLSIWREVLILTGASFQIAATYHAHAPWQLFMSPVSSMMSVGTMLGIILYYRKGE